MKTQKAFTLIELLIVVAIIAILAAIAVPNFLEAQTRAKVSRAKSDMRSLATGIESYQVDNNVPPMIVAVTSPYFLTGSGNINGPSVLRSNVAIGISSRLVAVTTPIAYITSVFQDPFIPPNVGLALDENGTPRDEYDTYDYVDARSLSPGGILGGMRGASASSGASWHVVSAGPDRINAFGGGTEDYLPIIRDLGVDYDPTNGTVSSGDIVRIGSGRGQIFDTEPAVDRINNKYNP